MERLADAVAHVPAPACLPEEPAVQETHLDHYPLVLYHLRPSHRLDPQDINVSRQIFLVFGAQAGSIHTD